MADPRFQTDIVPVNGRPQLVDATGAPLLHDEKPREVSGERVFALPHVLTFSSIWSSANRVYSWRWDEALKTSRADALSMRRDAFLMSILQERRLATAQLNWHLEPEDSRDPRQKGAADLLTKIIRGFPHLQKLFYSLLDAIWYGRYAAQFAYQWQTKQGRRCLVPTAYSPTNGDKIQYRFRLTTDGPEIEDGTPCILVHSSYVNDLRNAETVLTDRGRALWLRTPYWRERFCIHTHEIDDADFFEGEMAGGVHGVGVRSRIYWMDWIRKEWLSNVSDYLEKVGQGVLIFYYEAGNPESETQAIKAANEQSRNSVIVWPRPVGQEKQGAGVEPITMPMSGSETLLKMQQHMEEIIERYIIGQTGSSRSEAEGLGTHDGAAMQDTKYRLIRFDAANLSDSLSTDWVRVLQKWNCPDVPEPIKFAFDVDKPNAKDQLEAAAKAWSMGATVKEDEVMEYAGLSKPEEGDRVLKNPQFQQQPGMGQPGQQGGQGNPLAALMGGGQQGPAPGEEPQEPQQPQEPGAGSRRPSSSWLPQNGPHGGKWEWNPLTGQRRHAQGFGRDGAEHYVKDSSGHEHAKDGKFTGPGEHGGAANDAPKAIEAHAEAAKQSLRQDRHSQGMSALEAVGHTIDAAKQIGSEYVRKNLERLPKPVQAAVQGAYKLSMATFHAGQSAARAVAREVGGEEHAERVGHLCAVADIFGMEPGPWALAAAGMPAAAAALKFAPLGSMSYLAYSTAAHPVAVLNAARKAVVSGLHRLAGVQHPQRYAAQDALSGEQWAALATVLQRLQGQDGDWYAALVSTALDETHDLVEAVRLAEEVYGEGAPEIPDGDDAGQYGKWNESEHPRGQPENKGEFTSKKGGATGAKKEKVANTPPKHGVKLKKVKQHAFNGKPVETEKISKQEAGRIGESIIIAYLHATGRKDARPMNTAQSNFPIDAIQDHETIEIKTGQVSNGPGAQQWRLTIGEPGKAEKEWLARATSEQKAKWNARKQAAIHARKQKVLAEISSELGHEIRPATMTVLLDPAKKVADLYYFEGWHDRIGWTSAQAQQGYIGSYQYE